MTEKGPGSSASATDDVILRRIAERSPQWFPDLGPAPTLALRTLSNRPRCSLHVVRLSAGSAARQVLVKVRRGEVLPDAESSRPRLRPVSSTVAQLTALEHEGLQSIAAFVGAAHPSFGAVRPLDHLESESAIVMEYVQERTLRQACLAHSRLKLLTGSGTRPRRSDTGWHNAGAWLRAYHDASLGTASWRDKTPRQSTRGEVVDRFEAYGDFLTHRLGARLVGDVAARGAALATALLPAQLPLVVGHGDYVMRNMFVDEAGRITVFDPMPRWRMPYLEDIARFLVGLRLFGWQVQTHGAAYSRRELDRLERLFLSGYFAGEDVPADQVHCYQLLICLDKWSALIGPAGAGGWSGRVRTAASLPADWYVRREARRVLDVAEAAGGRGRHD